MRIENEHFEKTGRNARGVDVVAGLLRDLYDIREALKIASKSIGVEKLTACELVVNEQFRHVVDGELDMS